MKKTSYLFALLSIFAFAFVLSSCGDSTGSSSSSELVTQIVATNVPDVPEAVTTAKIDDCCKDYSYVVAEAAVENNSFTIDLPAAPPANCLSSLDELTDGGAKDFNVSDTAARALSFGSVTAYNVDDEWQGTFSLGYVDSSAAGGAETPTTGSRSATFYEAAWIYVDRALTMSGTQTEQDEGYSFTGIVDVNVREGWNVVYSITTVTLNLSEGSMAYNFKVTSSKPKVSMEWFFEGGSDYWAAPGGAATTQSANKSLFSIAKQRAKALLP